MDHFPSKIRMPAANAARWTRKITEPRFKPNPKRPSVIWENREQKHADIFRDFHNVDLVDCFLR